MPTYDEEAASSPADLLRNTSRKIKRWHRGPPRQQMVVLMVWIFIFYLGFKFVQTTTSSPSLNPSNLLSCDSVRDQLTQSIVIPRNPNIKALAKTWRSLQNTFDQNKPQPLDLSLKTFASVSEFPSLEEIKSHTSLSMVDAQASRESHAEVVRKLPEYSDDLYKGRGIVILAGGKFSGFATTGLAMLREIGSALPVEVWLKDKNEDKAGWCEDIEADGMICRHLSDYMDISKMAHGYQLKISAIFFSSFQQVLFLDADNVPVKLPDTIFESKTFTEKGAILWPDYWTHTGSPLLPYVIGLSDSESEMLREDRTTESGQLMWDKKRHWKSLCLAAYYNYYGPQHYYTLISQGWAGWGDKDTFPTALQALHEDYYMVPHELKTVAVNGTDQGIGMMQADPTNRNDFVPMFLHSNIIKWSIRNFLCIGCAKDETDPIDKSFLEQSDSPINPHLTGHERIFPLDDMKAMNIDPEPLIWKCMERTACRSVWKNDSLCTRTREHMSETFGHRFESPGMVADALGYGDHPCIRDTF